MLDYMTIAAVHFAVPLSGNGERISGLELVTHDNLNSVVPAVAPVHIVPTPAAPPQIPVLDGGGVPAGENALPWFTLMDMHFLGSPAEEAPFLASRSPSPAGPLFTGVPGVVVDPADLIPSTNTGHSGMYYPVDPAPAYWDHTGMPIAPVYSPDNGN